MIKSEKTCDLLSTERANILAYFTAALCFIGKAKTHINSSHSKLDENWFLVFVFYISGL